MEVVREMGNDQNRRILGKVSQWNLLINGQSAVTLGFCFIDFVFACITREWNCH